MNYRGILLARANAFWPTAAVGEANSVNSVSTLFQLGQKALALAKRHYSTVTSSPNDCAVWI